MTLRLPSKSLRQLAIGLAVLVLMVQPSLAQDAESSGGVSPEGDFRAFCANCHGESGKGDGPKAFGLSAPPPDLTLLKERHGGEYPRDLVASVIDGRADIALHGGREMPAWGQWFKMQAEEDPDVANGHDDAIKHRIEHLVDFIETLQE